MSQLQENIGGVVAAFYMGAQKCSPLSREELRQLMEQEFGDAMEKPQDPETIQKVLCYLSEENNSRVDFRELLRLVFHVAKACYKPLQQHQEMGDGQGLAEGGEELLWPHTVGRVPQHQQVPGHGVNSQDRDVEIWDQNIHQSQKGETLEQETHQIQEGETPEQETHQIQEGETPEKETHQIQEGETLKKDQDTHQIQEGETPEQETHHIQGDETPEQDEDTPQDDRTEAPEAHPERGEILDTETPEQDRNISKAEETTKQDQKPHQAQETETPGQGPNEHQSPEPEAAKQDPNSPSETQGEDPKAIQVCEVPWKDPNPGQTQQLLPPQWGADPQQDAKPLCDPDCHQIPESKGQEKEHEVQELQGQPVVEQQLLQPLCQWPPGQ
ncbi:CRNN protein, partial [Xiphorhynchus elegans]|nr:CRNN protein [Xiphorhynchus elegans]